jgi:hypothetical protein
LIILIANAHPGISPAAATGRKDQLLEICPVARLANLMPEFEPSRRRTII